MGNDWFLRNAILTISGRMFYLSVQNPFLIVLQAILPFLILLKSASAWPGNYGGTAISNGGLASMSAMSAMSGGMGGGMNSFANELAVPTEFGGSLFGMNQASPNFPNGYQPNPYRAAAASIGSM